MPKRPSRTLNDFLYGALLHVLPAEVRGTFGSDMAQMFRDRRRHTEGHPLALVRLWFSALVDVILAAVRYRWPGRHPGAASAVPPTGGGVGAFLGAVRQDVRIGVRVLARDRTFTAVAVLVLAIGIGANSAAFSLVNALLLKPRPGHPNGLVVGLYNKDTAHPDTFRAFSYPEFVDIAARRDVFAAVTAHNFAFVGLADGDHSRQVIVDMVSRGFFDVFGAPLLRGRTFTAEEERPGGDADVAILSYAAWQRDGFRSDAMGSTVRVNGRPMTVIGIAAKGFGGSLALMTPELWVPISAYDRLANDFVREGTSTSLADRRTRMLILDVQLQPGTTIASASPALQSMSASIAAADPTIAHSELMLAPLARLGVSTSPRTDSDLVSITVALLSLSGIVLLIASLNLANMLLARGLSRRKEFAIRLAIGGSRSRIVRQLLTEGLLLSMVGGAFGLALAQWSTWALAQRLAPYIPVSLMLDPTPDVRILAATAVFAVTSALLFSLGPAWTMARTDSVPALRSQAGEMPARSRFGSRHLLVGGQLALSLVMLTAAGLFVETSLTAATASPGFSMDRGILVQVDASLDGRKPAEATAIYARVLDRLRARGDVVTAGLASNFPLSGFSDQHEVRRAGAPRQDLTKLPAELVSISGDYFRAVGLPLLRGRDFGAGAMTDGNRHEAIIDAPLASRLFGQGDPVGQSIEYDPTTNAAKPIRLDVIGVVPGIGGDDGHDAGKIPHLFVPYAQESRASVYFAIATSTPGEKAEAALLPSFRQTFLGVDARLPILSVETLTMYRDRGIILALVRTAARIFGAFGLAALVLSAIGIYGVRSYVVSRRTREIGIRMALGATRSSVLWLVTREGIVVAVVGLAIGVGLSVPAAVGLRASLLPDTAPYAGIVIAAFGVLLATSLGAGVIPVRRAVKIEPVRALRTE